MTALDALLTKLASDEFDEKAFRGYFRLRTGQAPNEIELNCVRWQHQQTHARMSLLVEICKIQNAALEYYRGDKVNQGFKMVDLAGDVLAKIEAMAKEQT